MPGKERKAAFLSPPQLSTGPDTHLRKGQPWKLQPKSGGGGGLKLNPDLAASVQKSVQTFVQTNKYKETNKPLVGGADVALDILMLGSSPLTVNP